MLDGLRREFPDVITVARALPHPRVARASLFWSVMATFGAGFFASGIVTILFSLLFRLTTRETPLPTPFELAGLAGTAAALAVAWVGGGRTAVAGYLGVLVVARLLSLLGQIRVCGEFGGSAALGGEFCSVGGYLTALWPQLLGAGALRGDGQPLYGEFDFDGAPAQHAGLVLVHHVGGGVLDQQHAFVQPGVAVSELLAAAFAVFSGQVRLGGPYDGTEPGAERPPDSEEFRVRPPREQYEPHDRVARDPDEQGQQ